jgi:hypothetical protein
MKGTHCGTRALALAALLISLAAVAPAVAGATVTPSTPAAPLVPASVPAVPAAPSVPAVPAVPSVPAPTASKAAAPATSSAPVSNTPVSVSNGPDGTTVTINVPNVKANVGPSSGSVSGGASLPLKPVETAVAKTVAPASAKATKAASRMARKHKGARALTWANDDDGFNGSNDGDDDDNPMSGCVNGTWTTCTTIPITSASPFFMDNRCVNAMGGTIPSSSGTFTLPPGSGTQPPVGSEQVQFNQGTMTTWTRAQPGTFHGMPAMFIDVKTFNVGLHGVGTPSNADYLLGHDFVDDFTIVILIGGSSENKRTQDVLIVNHGAAPNMWFSEHDIVNVSLTGFQIQQSWRIVCQQNQKADDDPDQGDDHDRSGDMEKYRHAHRDYNGYKDDQPSSYDQND